MFVSTSAPTPNADANWPSLNKVGLSSFVAVMCRVFFLGKQKVENVERYHIVFAIQLIRCPFLNPRIRGVTILSDIIDVTMRNTAAR